MKPGYPTLWLIILLLSLTSLHGQKKGYEPGYVITLEGDTLAGQVRDRKEGPFATIYNRIRFIPDQRGRRKKFGPDDILGYRVGGREYEALPLVEESFFIFSRFTLRPGRDRQFLRVVRRDGPLTYYHFEFVDADSSYLDQFPLIYQEGEMELVRLTQGILGLRRKHLIAYFGDCPPLVQAIESQELRRPMEVFDFYLSNCGVSR